MAFHVTTAARAADLVPAVPRPMQDRRIDTAPGPPRPRPTPDQARQSASRPADDKPDARQVTGGEIQPAVPDAAPYPPPLAFGFRRDLEDRGRIFADTFTADLSRASQGFNTRTDSFIHLLDLRLNIQTDPMIGLPGGTLSVDYQNQSGRNGSGILGRHVQGFDTTSTPTAGPNCPNCGISRPPSAAGCG